MTTSPAELAQLRAILATLPRRPRSPETTAAPAVPFDALPPLTPALRAAIEAAALANNDRYLEAFLEPHSFCPFARGGRLRGQTRRIVHLAERAEAAPLLALFEDAAREPAHAVIQVILPMIEVAPEAWIRFCQDLTAAGNQARGEAQAVFAVAPLHPALRYSSANPYALIPLFRRTPDPTIQWVRLDALARLYAGRGSDKVYVDPEELDGYLARPRKSPLFERIAETNPAMATRRGSDEVERTLRDLADAARRRYTQLLLGAAPPGRAAAGGCLHRALATDTSPPRPALFARDDRWALAALDDLPPRAPRRFLADGVEVAVVRVDDRVHVLHGRCPHRNAPLSDAVVEVDRLVCPHHGWDFQLATGHSQGVPGAQVARFAAWIDDGLVWVDGRELRGFRASHAEVFEPGDDVL